jgi:hypothetical protein
MLARRHQIIESTSKLAVGGRPIRAHRLSLPGAAANRHQKVTCPPVLCGGYLLSLFRTTSLLRLREILTLIDLGHGRQPGRSSASMHHGRAMQNDTRSTFGTLFPAAPSRPAARRMIGPPQPLAVDQPMPWLKGSALCRSGPVSLANSRLACATPYHLLRIFPGGLAGRRARRAGVFWRRWMLAATIHMGPPALLLCFFISSPSF